MTTLTTTPATLSLLPLSLDAVKARALPVESCGHTFKAKFPGVCALSGAKIWGGEECRLVTMAGWDKPRCALNKAYGVLSNTGWYETGAGERVWTGRILATALAEDEILDLLSQTPGLVLKVWSTSQLFNNTDHYTPANTWRFDAASNKYIRSGVGGRAVKSRAQAKTCILGAKVFACTIDGATH